MKLNRNVFAGAAAVAALALLAAAPARAGDVYWSVGVQAAPGVVVGASNAPPVYVHPQPVYVQPQPVYVQPRPYPRSFYVQPAPVYVQPQPVYPQPGMSAMGVPSPLANPSAVMQAQMMPGGQMPMGTPYGTGAFVAVTMPGGGTGMVMLPPGYMPGMTGAFPAQMMPVPSQPQPPPQRGFLWKDILVGILAAVTVVAVVLIGKLALTPGRGSIILTVLPPRSAEVLLDNKPVGRVQP